MSNSIGLQNHHAYTPSRSTTGATKRQHFLKYIIILMILFLLINAVYYLVIIPFNAPARIQLSGVDAVLASAIKKTAGLTGTEKWGNLNKEVLLRRITAYPPVAEVQIIKKYPDKVLIEITERQPVGILLATVAERTIPMEIDKTGMVFNIASGKNHYKLPIISGLTFQHIRAGMKVHKQLVPLFKQLDILRKNNPTLLGEISEIKIEQKKYGGFDLILYPVQSHIKVRTGSTLNDDRLQYMMLMLDVIQKLDLSTKIEELDVRTGTASYRLRGEPDE